MAPIADTVEPVDGAEARPVHLAPRALALRAGGDRRLAAGPAGLCLSQRRAHRRFDLLDRQAGHDTPTGVFTILQKDKNHHSSTYNEAPMPNMNRLTWSGIALHAGQLPGYPASHGCVRLPMDFSAKLFTVTHVGTPVIIADSATFPETVIHPGMVLSAEAEKDFDHTVTTLKEKQIPMSPEAPYTPPVTSIMISSADSRVIVLDDGEIVADGGATILQPSQPLGNHVFVLAHINPDDRELHWKPIGYSTDPKVAAQSANQDTLTRIRADRSINDAIRARMKPGVVLVTVDLPLSADSRTGKDFVILNDQGTV
ncbi:MAG: L,D-transpeptidase family protein [Candidatus Kaistia colombiensis]|nr:MAG: L,D-transpeptidase family protein [Kaistia sp.]